MADDIERVESFVMKHWPGFSPEVEKRGAVYSILLTPLASQQPSPIQEGLEPCGESTESFWAAVLDLHSRFSGTPPMPTEDPFKG